MRNPFTGVSLLYLVRTRGLEPPPLTGLPPQGSASTNFATSAQTVKEPQYHTERRGKTQGEILRCPTMYLLIVPAFGLMYGDMGKIVPLKPIVVLMYGMPGSGKTFFARQLCESLQAAHLQADRIRTELFQEPAYSKEENHIVASLMAYMTGEFLRSGVSVIFDMNVPTIAQRRALRNMAQKLKAEPVLVWFQVDPDTSFGRAARRDKRTADDHFAQTMTPELFRRTLSTMQNPDAAEKFIVVSGKHVFNMQKNAFFRDLRQRHLVASQEASEQVSKPGLINLVPSLGSTAAGRVDLSRRNINIH